MYTFCSFWRNFNSSQYSHYWWARKRFERWSSVRLACVLNIYPTYEHHPLEKREIRFNETQKFHFEWIPQFCRNIFFCKRSDNYLVNWFKFSFYLNRLWKLSWCFKPYFKSIFLYLSLINFSNCNLFKYRERLICVTKI